MQVSLVMFKADGTRRDFPIAKKRTVMGRTSTCDLRIPLSSVSREHCEMVIEGDAISVRDLGSSNGTFLNETRVKEGTVEAGDRLVIGPVVFTVVVNGRPEQIKPIRSAVGPPTGVSADDGGPDPADPGAANDDSDDELPLLAEEAEKPRKPQR